MKRNVKIVAIATAIILALPVFENQKGIGIVKANGGEAAPRSTTSTTPAPTGTDSPAPTNSATPSALPSTSPEPSATPSAAPSETPSAAPSTSATPSPIEPTPQQAPVQETSGTVSTHEHSFEYVTIQEASETQDAIIQLQCSCGETNGTFTEAGSSVHLFIRHTFSVF